MCTKHSRASLAVSYGRVTVEVRSVLIRRKHLLGASFEVLHGVGWHGELDQSIQPVRTALLDSIPLYRIRPERQEVGLDVVGSGRCVKAMQLHIHLICGQDWG